MVYLQEKEIFAHFLHVCPGQLAALFGVLRNSEKQ